MKEVYCSSLYIPLAQVTTYSEKIQLLYLVISSCQITHRVSSGLWIKLELLRLLVRDWELSGWQVRRGEDWARMGGSQCPSCHCRDAWRGDEPGHRMRSLQTFLERIFEEWGYGWENGPCCWIIETNAFVNRSNVLSERSFKRVCWQSWSIDRLHPGNGLFFLLLGNSPLR